MNISVIIPVYNVEKYIERCLRSVMNQTFTESIECIIINDCTPDNSMKIAEKLINGYKGDIVFRIISHEYNKGIAAARNTGIKAATGTYIQYIDSDDYIEPTMLEEMYKEALRTNADIVGCEYYEDYGSYKIINNHFKFQSSPEYNLYQLMYTNYTANLWRRLTRKTLYIQNNISAIEGINMAEDVMIAIQLHYFAHSVAYVAKPLYHYMQNPNSLVHSVSIKQIQEIVKAYTIVEDFLRQKNIYEKYKTGFLKRCFGVKAPLIVNKNVRNHKLWKEIYPESHKYINQICPRLIQRIYWKAFAYSPSIILPFLFFLTDLRLKFKIKK